MVNNGVIVGRWGGHLLRFRGPENLLLLGPERSGKGIGIFIPTLLEIGGHTLIVDIRGETYEATAGYRATTSRVLRLALTQPDSTRFSLPGAIRKGTPHEFFDAATIAEMHTNPGGGEQHGQAEEHWKATSRAFLTGCLLYEVHTRALPSMAHLASFWSTPGMEPHERLAYVVRNAPTRQVAELGQEVLNKTGKEASSLLSSMMKELFVYRDPVIAANTSYCDFALEDFTRHDRFLSLYLVMSPAEEEHVRPWLRCFLRLLLGRLMELGETRHQLTLLLDEFPSYGRMDFLLQWLGMLGGRGIRTLLAAQNVPQLARVYGNADMLTEHAKVKIYFSAQGQTTGKEISRQVGTGTATTMQESTRADGWSWAIPDSRTQQAQQHARPLLTDGEATEIPPDTCVVKVSEHPPIWARKVRFFEHRPYRQRSQIPFRRTP